MEQILRTRHLFQVGSVTNAILFLRPFVTVERYLSIPSLSLSFARSHFACRLKGTMNKFFPLRLHFFVLPTTTFPQRDEHCCYLLLHLYTPPHPARNNAKIGSFVSCPIRYANGHCFCPSDACWSRKKSSSCVCVCQVNNNCVLYLLSGFFSQWQHAYY